MFGPSIEFSAADPEIDSPEESAPSGVVVDAPTNLQTYSPTWTTVTVGWDAVTGASYEWTVTNVASGGATSGTLIEESSGIGLTDLLHDSGHTFRIRSVVGSARSSWAEITFNTPVIPQVEIINLTSHGNGSEIHCHIAAVNPATLLESGSMLVHVEDTVENDSFDTDLAYSISTPNDPFIITGVRPGNLLNIKARCAIGSQHGEWSNVETYISYPESGYLLGTFCDGFNLTGTYADGAGGTYPAVITANAAECGFTDLDPPPDPP